MNNGVLLESGTNELEILEFRLGNHFYGINVAKVREILPYQKPTLIPNAHPSIEGIFMPRDLILTVIDLAKDLNILTANESKTDMTIITNFNKLNVAFHVHGVVGIHRISWKDIHKPDDTINSVATGIVKLNDKLIVVLDFEKIVSEISPETGVKTSDIIALGNRKRNDSPILISEDSPFLNNLIIDCLRQSGYTNIITTVNGDEAWNKLVKYKEENSVYNKVKCVITDIEMPQMDGHHLTRLIKEDADLKHIPVIIFSSLINDEMRRKGELLGADAQISKPEIGSLIGIIDKLILN
jgi:two-component system chemotaxis response regulator CheV